MRLKLIALSVFMAFTALRLFAQEQQVFIPSLLSENNQKALDSHKSDIFYQAIVATHLNDSLAQYKDMNYPTPQYDSTLACLELTGWTAVEYETAYETREQRQRVVWPEQRFFKYTLFVVSDSILQRVYDINSLYDLRQKAKSIYPEGAALDDTDRNSSLYKLISYHILPYGLSYSRLNYTDQYVVNNYLNSGAKDEIDIEDFYETMHPHAIMRISTPYDEGSGNNGNNIYINRKGTVSAGNLESQGIRIWQPLETPEISSDATNGSYFYVDSLLLFNQATKNALNTRIRVMFSALSPDFINSGARGRMRYNNSPTSFAVYAFKEGFCKNVRWSPETMFAVRYQDRSWGCYHHDLITVKGDHNDITFRLPPVPESGIYEIRISDNTYRFTNDRQTVLHYIRKENNDFIPCGTPVNLTGITPELIGYIRDEDLREDGMSDQEWDAAITANDNAMRKRGYMKAPDSFSINGGTLRDYSDTYRRIIGELYMEAGKDYFLRLRQLNSGSYSILNLNYLEIVPYSIYSGENGSEDRH